MTRLSVTVTGPPFAIWRRNRGTTEPLDPNTLPKRTAAKVVLEQPAMDCTTISHRRLLAPMTEVGFTALSVEIRMNFLTPWASAARTVFSVPNTLLRMASWGLVSIRGTCLWAAAWNTTSGL